MLWRFRRKLGQAGSVQFGRMTVIKVEGDVSVNELYPHGSDLPGLCSNDAVALLKFSHRL